MTDIKNIDWKSSESRIVLDARMPSEWQARVREAQRPKLPGHIWLATSGSTVVEAAKLVALSKKSFLASAQSVNEHLSSDANDIWLKILPDSHVNGLATYARCELSGAKLIDISDTFTWEPSAYVESLQEHQASLSALLPEQVFDLVQAQVQPPSQLRGLIVCGGALREGIYVLARKLGWPVLPSYGMAECCSMVACAELSSLGNELSSAPLLKVLPGAEVASTDEGQLKFKGPMVFSGYLHITLDDSRFVDPKEGGYYLSDDVGELAGSGELKVFGKYGLVKKIGSELINFARLNGILGESLEELGLPMKAEFIPRPSVRLGHRVDLVLHESLWPHQEQLVSSLADRLQPIERPRAIYMVQNWPMTALGRMNTYQR